MSWVARCALAVLPLALPGCVSNRTRTSLLDRREVRVVDPDGKGVPGVLVLVHFPGSPAVGTVTDALGRFSIVVGDARSDTPLDVATLTLSRSGFESRELPHPDFVAGPEELSLSRADGREEH